ncbi:MAG: DNA alkylation repair protein [Bacteroidales bacterium]|nr:DNA alkylation repair protein [Bacteroidales bacterium]
MTASEYAGALQSCFIPYSNAYNAGRMSRYMLDKFEFSEFNRHSGKKLVAEFVHIHGLPSPEQLDDTVMHIWNLPQRELHYAIMEIASRKVYLTDPERIKLFEFMITTNSWWDTVDFIAANLVGAWLVRHKAATENITQTFMQSDNMWLQRTVLLFQLKYKKETNHELLFATIRQLNGSKEFFIRKAIGWALREYSKTNPESVISFTNNTELSPLSRREALKVVSKKGII